MHAAPGGMVLQPAAVTILWAPNERPASTRVDDPGFHVEPRGERSAILRTIPASPLRPSSPRGETDAARGALERAERSVGSPDGTLDTVDRCEATSGPAAGPRESGVDRGRFGSRGARPRGRSGRLCPALRALPCSNPQLPASHGRRPRVGRRSDAGYLHQGV